VIFRRDAKVRLLSAVPLFQACSQPELARVAGIMSQFDVPDGKVLIREGEPGRDFFVLAEGKAEVRKGSRRVATLGPGDFAGEIALLTNAPRTATVRTTSAATVLRVTTKGFSDLLATSPTIQRKINKALADRVAPTAL
jgi:CRP-like cAMP-binding protein